MGRFIDLGGQVYGRLLVNHYIGGVGSKWNCSCTCGQIIEVEGGHIRSGHTTSCGCFHSDDLAERNFKHGLNGLPEYRVWLTMRERCSNPKCDRYKYYGARGIKVCKRWDSFVVFIEDMGRRPTAKHTIDRYPDNNGNYEPDNCRWATWKQQNDPKNKRAYGTALEGYQC